MSVYIKYRLGWYDLLAAPSWGREVLSSIRRFGTVKWIISLVLMGVIDFTLWQAWQQGHMGPAILVLATALFDLRLFGLSLIILSLMVIAFDRLEDSHPVMRISVLNVFSKARSDGENVLLWTVSAPLIWWPGMVSLFLGMGYFTSLEEIYFRDQNNWFTNQVLPDVVQAMMINQPAFGALFWGMMVFGLVHLYSGARLGDCLALGLVGGGWFVWQAASGGLHTAAVSHANYNLLAIAYMLSPQFQLALRQALSVVLVQFGRKPLKKDMRQRVRDLPSANHTPVHRTT